MHTIYRLAFTLSLTALFWPRDSHASTGERCGQGPSAIFPSESAIFPLHECAGGFADWHWAELHINQDDWRGRFEHPCDLSFEYAKHVNSAWLIWSQVHPSSGPGPRGRAFHAGRDYVSLMKGDDTAWHNNYRHTVHGGYDASGQFLEHPVDENESQTFCTLYDWDQPMEFRPDCGGCPPPDPNSCPPGGCIIPGKFYKPTNWDFPSERAITIIHEGWHAWEHRNLNSDYAQTLEDANAGGHQLKATADNPAIGNCTQTDECDHFYMHGSNTFAIGELKFAGRKTDYDTGDPLPRHYTFHTTYQVEIEYACDLADYGNDAIPYSVRELAALTARIDLGTRAVETVPFYCGSTRPMWTKDPGANITSPPPCLDQNRHNCGGGAAGACPMGDVNGCGTDGCCLPNCVDSTRQCLGFAPTGGLFCSNPAATCNPMSGCCNVTSNLKVDATMLSDGPRICVHGQGFEPGTQVTVSYLNVPNASGPIQSFSAGVGNDGKFDLTDTSQQIAFGSVGDCPPSAQNAEVTVLASQPTSGFPLTSEGRLPARMWCRNLSQPNVVGDGCP
jgi:hypothetical protein